jgi:hypothetical protein
MSNQCNNVFFTPCYILLNVAVLEYAILPSWRPPAVLGSRVHMSCLLYDCGPCTLCTATVFQPSGNMRPSNSACAFHICILFFFKFVFIQLCIYCILKHTMNFLSVGLQSRHAGPRNQEFRPNREA